MADSFLQASYWQGIAAHIVGSGINPRVDCSKAVRQILFRTDQQENAVFDGRRTVDHHPMHALQAAGVGDVVAH